MSLDGPNSFDVEVSTQYFDNRSRYSVSIIDDMLIKALDTIYGNMYDGIIALQPLPNRVLSGFQPREICVFNHTKVTYISEIPQIHLGGTNTNTKMIMLKALDIRTPELEQLNREATSFFNTYSSSIRSNLDKSFNNDLPRSVMKLNSDSPILNHIQSDTIISEFRPNTVAPTKVNGGNYTKRRLTKRKVRRFQTVKVGQTVPAAVWLDSRNVL